MRSAAFFGHRNYGYENFRGKLREILTDLIENRSVTRFYNGFRGNFDVLCAEVVFELMQKKPSLENLLVLSYHPSADFRLPKYFNASVYLLEKPVPPKFAIFHTNRLTVDRADFIVSGVVFHRGGAFSACEYARRKNKIILDLLS